MHIRAATREDGPAFLRLVHELADYEKLPGPTSEDGERLLEDAFGPSPRFNLFVAQEQDDLVAYAVVFETYSTFSARPVLYLEDVYVTPLMRGAGVGRAMMRHLAAETRRRGCVRLAWVVLDWNATAIKFYEELGAKAQSWVPYQLEGEALTRLAESDATDAPITGR